MSEDGYTGKWNSYTLQLNDIEINASYTVITYKATFMSKGQVVAIVNFTVNDTSITEPEVPFIEGLTGKWEPYTLGTADIVIYALYTDSEGNIVDPDEPVDPDKPDGPDTPDTPDEPDTEEKPDEDDEKKENKLIAWLIFLFLCIIILIVWIISGKDDDDDDGDENPEQPVVIPPAADIPEEAPVENIDIVPEVDVETADKLMTDAVAMTVIETVGGAGVGMKSIVNVCDINKAFSDGDTVDLDALKAKKLVSKKTQRVKILADGILNKSFTVYAEQFSVQAIKMITLTGGKAIQKK